MRKAVGDSPSAGTLGIIDGQRLIDGLDVDARSGGAAGVGRHIPAALTEAQAGIASAAVIQDADREDRAVLQPFYGQQTGWCGGATATAASCFAESGV